jgi:hypothetical protein
VSFLGWLQTWSLLLLIPHPLLFWRIPVWDPFGQPRRGVTRSDRPSAVGSVRQVLTRVWYGFTGRWEVALYLGRSTFRRRSELQLRCRAQSGFHGNEHQAHPAPLIQPCHRTERPRAASHEARGSFLPNHTRADPARQLVQIALVACGPLTSANCARQPDC